MNRILAVIFLSLIFFSCKGPKLIPGKPTISKGKLFIEKVEESSLKSDYIKIKANGRYEQGDDNQSFRADIRIKKDSIIWIELSDPLIGIKAARAFITPDSVAFLNKIQNEYFTGSFDYLNNKLQTRVDFSMIQNLLLGEPLRKVDVGESYDLKLNEEFYMFYYFPKEDPLFQFTTPNYYYEIEPNQFKIIKQEAADGGQKVRASYSSFKMEKKQYLPHEVLIELYFDSSIKLEFEYTDIKLDEKLSFPFKLSSRYKRIE